MKDNELDTIPARILAAADRLNAMPSAAELADACSLLRDMLQAAEKHGVTLAHFDYLVDLPQAAVQGIRHRDRDAGGITRD